MSLPVHVALVSNDANIAQSELAEVAAALQTQVSRDFGPVWHRTAIVQSFPSERAVPLGFWKVLVEADIHEPGAAGYHTDDQHQPYALVESAGDWTVTVSHELLEMLADPWGNRLHTAMPPTATKTEHKDRVRYLVEVCDPCEEVVYDCSGVRVSDFLLPEYYHTLVRYLNVENLDPKPASFTGALKRPGTILPGGYVSYVLHDGTWEQQTWWGHEPQVQTLGKANPAAKSLRAWVDEQARLARAAIA
jgi:hypothetical protein